MFELGEARDAVANAAEDCAVACLEAISRVDAPSGSILQSVAGVALVAAERARLSDPLELVAALSLCARMIESASEELDRLGETAEGLAAGRAARRCVATCRQALVVLYDAA